MFIHILYLRINLNIFNWALTRNKFLTFSLFLRSYSIILVIYFFIFIIFVIFYLVFSSFPFFPKTRLTRLFIPLNVISIFSKAKKPVQSPISCEFILFGNRDFQNFVLNFAVYPIIFEVLMFFPYDFIIITWVVEQVLKAVFNLFL